MRQPGQRWVDCTDAVGRMRQVRVMLAEDGALAVTLPATGETGSLQLYQAEQLRTAVVYGIERARSAAARGGSSR